jgi:hypothetical protein
MLKEIRKMRKRSTAVYIYKLQERGLIGKYVNEKGYVCYDPQELKKYKSNSKIGRPPKKEN